MAKKQNEPDSGSGNCNAVDESQASSVMPDDGESSKAEISLATVSDKALELLARREHSRVELKEKLRRREYGYPAEYIETVLNDFADRNLQSDERFAEVYVRSRVGRGYGEIKIRAELQSRGVGGDTISLALEASDADWYDNADAALQKKFLIGINAENLRSQKFRGKMQRFLQNRGYNPDQIISAVNRMADFVDANAEASAE